MKELLLDIYYWLWRGFRYHNLDARLEFDKDATCNKCGKIDGGKKVLIYSKENRRGRLVVLCQECVFNQRFYENFIKPYENLKVPIEEFNMEIK